MAYSIYSNELPETVIKTYPEVRLMEAFFRGMKINYTLVSSNGEEMQVTFLRLETMSLDVLETKIEMVLNQIKLLERNNKIESKEKVELQTYYRNKLSSYVNRKKSIINAINVNAEIVTPVIH